MTLKYNEADINHRSLIKIEENLLQDNEILCSQVKESNSKSKLVEDRYLGIEVKYANLFEKQ
jgi:hypothetical protein